MKRVYRRVVRSIKRLFKLHRVLATVAIIIVAGLIVGGGVYASLGGSPKNETSGDVDLQKGLVSWWKLDGNAKDATPYANNGTVSGATLTTDKKAKTNAAYSFDGINDGITTTDKDVFSPFVNDMSMSFWAHVPTGASAGGSTCTSSGRYMLAKGNTSNFEWAFKNDGNTAVCIVLWTLGGGGIYAQTSASMTVNDGNWHHYTATIDYGVRLTLYVDGIQANTTTSFGSPMGNGNQAITIGQRGDGQYFTGDVDDVRIYNRLLNTAEISALYNTYGSGISAASGEKSLVGWWKMDGNAKDTSPYGNNGTVTGATLTTDRKGKAISAYDFNGSSQYMTMSPVLPTDDFTYSAWIKLDDNTDEMVFMASNGNSGTEDEFFLLVAAGNLKTRTNNSTRATSVGIIPTGAWTHVAVTRLSGTITLYINGVADGTGSDAGVLSFPGCSLYIGIDIDSGCSGSIGNYLDGSVDDARVYNRGLSAAEIKQQYQSYGSQVTVSDLQKDMVGYWPLNGNAKDATPYGNNGTLVNSPSLTTDRKARANSAYAFVVASSQYINLGSSVPSIISGDFTISAWAKTSTGGNATAVFAQGIPASWPNNLLSLYYGDTVNASGGVEVWLNTSLIIVNTTSVVDSIWHHIALTRTGSTMYLYKDGIQIGTATNGSTFTATSSSIGANNNNGTFNQFFAGSLDELRIWKRYLPAAEVKALYELYK